MNGVPIIANSVHVSKEMKRFLPNSFPCLQVMLEEGKMKRAGSALGNKLCACAVSCCLTDSKIKIRKAISKQLVRAYRMSSYSKYIGTSAERFQSILVIVLIVEAA